MNKLIALFSTGFFVFTLTGVNAWASDPKPKASTVERHAVWTNTVENHKKESGSAGNQNAKAASEKQTKMEVKTKDRPWKRVG
jgi:hypothetical protein